MNTVKQIVLLMGFLLVCWTASAQKKLNIDAIFDAYGKQKGSILIELGKDVLDNRTQIKRYKSLTIPSETAGIIGVTEEAIAKDTKEGHTLIESRKSGTVEMASYCLKKDEKSPEYEYILFFNTSPKMILIYVRGNFYPEQLEYELSKLKRLSIKVNNKRINL